MMKRKYRIKEVTSPSGDKAFFILRKYFGFLWLNPLNINAYITGRFETKQEAEEMLEVLRTKNTVKYWEYRTDCRNKAK